MNKVYKVIWSKVRNCYMVVSELAKRNGKNTGTTDKRRKLTGGLALAAMALTLNLGTVGIAEAGYGFAFYPDNSSSLMRLGNASGTNALAGGQYATASGDYSIAVGYYAQATANSAIATGYNAQATANSAIATGYSAQAIAQYAIATGHSAQATSQDAIALGRSSKALAKDAIALGRSTVVYTEGSIAIGSNNGIIRPGGTLNDKLIGTIGGNSIAIGTGAKNFTYNEMMANPSYAHTKNSIAIGYNSHTHAANAFAIGVSTDATAERSFAIGTSATQNANQHLGTRAAGQGSIAFGDQAMAVATKHIPNKHDAPEGRAVDLEANDAAAIGTKSLARAKNAVALGGGVSYTSMNENGENITIYGYDDKGTLGEGNRGETGATVNIGADAGIALGGASSKLMTEAANVGKNAEGAIAIGTGAAIGDDAIQSVAVGLKNRVEGQNSTAVGQMNQVAGQGSGAFGYGTGTNDRPAGNAISGDVSYVVGYDNKVGKEEYENVTYKDFEENPTVTELMLKRSNATSNVFVVGGGNKIAQQESDAGAISINVFGSSNTVKGAEESKNSSIIGNNNTVTNKLIDSLVAGNKNENLNQITNSQIIGNSNTNIGTEVSDTVVLGNSTTISDKTSSAIAIGQETTVNANNAIAIGTNAKSEGLSSTALGKSAHATKESSTALGNGAHATMESSTALGTGAQANLSNSVALGSGTTTQAGVAASKPNGGVAIGGATYGSHPWANTLADTDTNKVVSVGNRQMNQVAAGQVSATSTDAINGSQLYAAYQDLQWKAGVSKNGGKVSGEVPQQVIGNYEGSRNNGVVNFKAGRGIEIETANKGSLDMTFKLNLQDGKNTKVVDDPDGTLKIDAYDTKVQAGAGLKLEANGDTADANNVRTYKLGIDPAALPVVTVNGGTPAPSNGTYSSDGNLNIKSTTDVPTGRTTYDIKLADKVTLGGNYINQVTLDGTTGKVTVGDKINLNGNTGIARIGDVHIVGNTGHGTVSGLSNRTWNPNTTYTGGMAATQEQLQTVQNNLQWNIGTGTTETSTPTFLKPVGGDKHDVVIREGEGIRIDASERTGGYDIVVNSDFTELTTTVPGGHFIDSITYKGQEYFINGGSGGGTVDVVSDNRAVIMAAESKDVKDDLGQVIGRKHYIKLHSPYINVHGLNGTEFHEEPQDYFAKAEKTGALAIGIHSKAAEENSTAIGHNADAMAAASTAIGYNSHAHGDNSVAVGLAATTSGNRAISIGTSASHTSNEDYNPTNPHQGARAAGQGTIVLGDRAMAISSEYQADNTYIENPGPDYTVNDAIAIGTRVQARARNGIALGGNTSYTYYDEENKQYVTVYGADDDVLGGRNNGAEVGDNAVSGIAIGGAYGKFNEDTKTIHQEMDAAATFGIRGIAIGSGALVANPDDFADLKEALSDPNYVKIKRDFLTARSNHLEAKADWDAIKDLTVNDPSMPEGMRITQVKYDAAREKYERTLKVMNDATAKYSMALKEVVRLQAKDAVLEEDAIAIGTLSNASIKDSVALGSKSITDANDKAGSRTGMSGYDPLGKASNNDLFRGDSNYSEDDPVWRSTAGSLSIGGTYYKKDDNGGYVTDADGNLVVDKVITRRISHVAAGIKDSDAVNVAQLKRATTLSSDGRNTALGIDESGNMIVNSPFLAISGVQESSDNNSIVRKYRNDGGADGYVKGLQAESTEIEGRIASIKKTQSDIDKALNGYYDNNGNFVDGIEQQYAKRQNLEKQFKDGQITPEKYLEESAKLITETDYRAHKMEYTDQLTATNERLSALNDSKQEYDELLANNGEKAKTKYKEAETFFNSQANASGTDSMALGKEAKAGGKQSVVLGTGNEVGTAGDIDNNDSENVKANREKEATRSIAIGSNNKIKGKANTESSTDSIAFGTDNEIYGSQNTAIGTGHKMYGEKSGTMGDPNVLAANYSYVIGNDNTIGNTTYENGDEIKNQNIFIMGNENVIPEGQNHVYVLGSGVNATTDHSVFLGDHAGYVEDDGATTKGTTKGYTKATVSGITFGNFAGGDENQVAGVVSVGGNVDGVMTTRRIQNVAPGLITAESTDAINGSQLYAAIQALTVDVKGDGTTTDVEVEKTTSSGGGGGSTAATTYTVKGSVTTVEGIDNITVTDTKNEENDPKSYHYKVELKPDITVDSVTAGTGDNQVVLNKDGAKIGDTTINNEGLAINGGPSVKKSGINAGDKKITHVADGGLSESSTDAVNGRQLYEVKNSGLTFNGDTGTSEEVKLGEKLDIKGDNNNITTEASKGQLNIKLKKDLDLGNDGSVKTGDTTIDNSGMKVGDTTVNNTGVTIQNGPSMTAADGFKYGDSSLNKTGLTVGNTTVDNNGITIKDGDKNGPSMTKDGIDAGGKPITNVAKGEADTDAVNVAQMREYTTNNNQALHDLDNQINNVDNRAKKGIAGAAALAALHPMEFDPDDKLTFAAGMGHYRGETAAALGMFYRPDEKVMFSLGGTVGNGENMVNAGVSFSLDRTPRVTGSRTALTKEVVALREHVARQDAQIAELTALVRQLAGNAGVNMPAASSLPTAMPALYPDNLDTKWAYDKLEELEQQGYIKGYAGRALTRSEFAAALDNALKGGATLDERLIKEFEPELSHVRVAHVEGNGNEEGKWYERPRFSHDKLEKKHEIEKKNSRVVTAKQK